MVCHGIVRKTDSLAAKITKIVIPLVTGCLGVWQLYRMDWKTKLIQARNELFNTSALTLEEALR